MPIWNCILQQNVQVSCSKDSWKWKCSSTGEINFKSSWELVRNSDPQYQFSNLMWFPSHSPKMAICLLRALHSKLLTRDFLVSLGISDINTCVLCNSDTESMHHFFFVCPYTAYLWSLFRLKLGILGSIVTLQDEAILIQTKFKRKRKITILAKLTLSAVVWHIWKERSHRIFQLQGQHKIMVFHKLYEDIRILLRTCNWKTDKYKNQPDVLSNWNIQ